MVIALDPGAGSEHVAVVDDAHKLFTDSARLERLFGEGCQFEAAAAQALVVEALCTMYLLLRSQAYRIEIVDGRGRPARLGGKLTFGRVIALLESSNAFHVEGLGELLRRYVDLRNDLTHQLAGTSLLFDLDGFFSLGRKIISVLRPHFIESLPNSAHDAMEAKDVAA